MAEGIGVMQADVRELYEVGLAVDEVKDDFFCDVFHHVDVEVAVLLRRLESMIDVLDGIGACFLGDDVIRRQQLEVWV